MSEKETTSNPEDQTVENNNAGLSFGELLKNIVTFCRDKTMYAATLATIVLSVLIWVSGDKAAAKMLHATLAFVLGSGWGLVFGHLAIERAKNREKGAKNMEEDLEKREKRVDERESSIRRLEVEMKSKEQNYTEALEHNRHLRIKISELDKTNREQAARVSEMQEEAEKGIARNKDIVGKVSAGISCIEKIRRKNPATSRICDDALRPLEQIQQKLGE